MRELVEWKVDDTKRILSCERSGEGDGIGVLLWRQFYFDLVFAWEEKEKGRRGRREGGGWTYKRRRLMKN